MDLEAKSMFSKKNSRTHSHRAKRCSTDAQSARISGSGVRRNRRLEVDATNRER
jgi:hypothetical protein